MKKYLSAQLLDTAEFLISDFDIEDEDVEMLRDFALIKFELPHNLQQSKIRIRLAGTVYLQCFKALTKI